MLKAVITQVSDVDANLKFSVVYNVYDAEGTLLYQNLSQTGADKVEISKAIELKLGEIKAALAEKKKLKVGDEITIE